MSMKEAMGIMIEQISDNVPRSESEYMGEDGLLRCSVCHKKVQTVVEFLGIKKTVRCICDCTKKEMDAHKERERQEALERQRMICFAETNMANWTFENDDRSMPNLSTAMQNYVKNFDKFKQEGKGLLLYGSVGTGKTYYAACIANALIDLGYSAYMTNFINLVSILEDKDTDRKKYLDSLNKYTVLILDDLGAERQTEYVQEKVYAIIDARYRSGLPFIVTTNLTAEELKKPSDVTHSRIYDRILERCHPVKVEGSSRRRESVKTSFADTQILLGL